MRELENALQNGERGVPQSRLRPLGAPESHCYVAHLHSCAFKMQRMPIIIFICVIREHNYYNKMSF